MRKNSKVTIIMYHYVRDLKNSRFPNIKGLDLSFFKEQIEYLNRHYHIITMEMLIDAIESNSSLPEKSLLLSFDDAYIDHYLYVFPLLDQKKIQGSFFLPVKAILEHSVLDVNKIHFILAAEENKAKIIAEIKKELAKYRDDFDLQDDQYYYDKLAESNRFDSADVVFIKRLLQVELNEFLRKTITNNLFQKIIGMNEELFSTELYMNMDQIKCMKKYGMHFGSHGYDHYWLNSLTAAKQEIEIKKSLDFIYQINGNMQSWTLSYPYGAYTNETIRIINELGCKLAITTKVDIADISTNSKYELPRLDTNDFPKTKGSIENNWYQHG